jgi:hypothetical protein
VGPAAYRALVGAAGVRTAALPPSGASGAELDEIETMLRRASRLKGALVRTELRLGIDTLEQRLGGPLDALPPARARTLALGLIGVIADAVDRFDPSRGGRLAAPVSLALGRWCAQVPDVAASPEPGRAARRLPAGVPVPDWTRRIAPWQAWLEPDPRLRGVLGRLDEDDRTLLARRFGLGETLPESLAAIAASEVKRAVHLARAVRRALALAREPADAGNKAGPPGDTMA